jgi:hypothetical protein
VRESLQEKERISWIVVMETGVGCVIENVKKGLPLTRKNLKFDKRLNCIFL